VQQGDLTQCFAVHGFIIFPFIQASRSIISSSFHAAGVLLIRHCLAVGIGVNPITIVYCSVLNLFVIVCGCVVPSSNYADSVDSILKPVVIAYSCIFPGASCAGGGCICDGARCAGGPIFQSASCASGRICQSTSFGSVINIILVPVIYGCLQFVAIVCGRVVQSRSCVGIFCGVIIEASVIYRYTGERYQTSSP
jgi:hypothetical protein